MSSSSGGMINLRKRREDEKFFAATLIVIFAVVLMTGVVGLAAFEVAFFGDGDEYWMGRCWLNRISGTTFDEYMLQLILFFVTYGSGLVAKRLDSSWRWWLLFGTSFAGAFCCLYLWVRVPESDVLPWMASLGECAAVPQGSYDDLVAQVQWLLAPTFVWYCGIISTQLGIQLPKRSSSPDQQGGADNG